LSLTFAHVLQASFTCNNYCCTKTKPAESLPSSNPVKRFQKKYDQSKPIIWSAYSEIVSRKTWSRLAKVLGNQMQLSILFITISQGAKQSDAIKHLSNTW